MLSVYKRSNWISWCLFIELKSEEEFKDAFWNHIFVWECTFYQLDYMVAIKTSSSRNGLNWMKWKVLKSTKKVDEIEKLLNFLFIVWSVCFLFTNTDKSLAFFYSLIYIAMRISIGAFCNSIATSKCTFQYNHLRNVKNRRLIMEWHIPPLCDTWMNYLNGCSLSS